MTDHRELIPIKKLIQEGHVLWKSDRSVKRAIADEKFPHVMINGHYFFDLAEVKLWYKKREKKAS